MATDYGKIEESLKKDIGDFGKIPPETEPLSSGEPGLSHYAHIIDYYAKLGDEHIYLGALIKALREQRGMDQKELAALSGRLAQEISRYENNEMNPETKTADRIFAALGYRVSVEYRIVIEELPEGKELPKNEPGEKKPIRLRAPRTGTPVGGGSVRHRSWGSWS
jgi:transcriptional regulator with XRE-family HTH domain